MGNIIEVNINTLEQDTDAVRDKMEGIKREVAKLDRIMSELNGMWEGASKKIYLQKLAQEKENIDALLEEADRIAKKMGEAVTIYKKCEMAVGQEIDEIRV